MVGEGKIGMMSTASKLSKFGVPLTQETKDRVLELYKTYPWLNGIHFHVGSQGVPIELFVNGAKVKKFVSHQSHYVKNSKNKNPFSTFNRQLFCLILMPEFDFLKYNCSFYFSRKDNFRFLIFADRDGLRGGD